MGPEECDRQKIRGLNSRDGNFIVTRGSDVVEISMDCDLSSFLFWGRWVEGSSFKGDYDDNRFLFEGDCWVCVDKKSHIES